MLDQNTIKVDNGTTLTLNRGSASLIISDDSVNSAFI